MPSIRICEDVFGQWYALQHSTQRRVPGKQLLVWQSTMDVRMPVIKVNLIPLSLHCIARIKLWESCIDTLWDGIEY